MPVAVGALGPHADGAPCRSAKGVEGEENGEGTLSCRLWGLGPGERRKVPHLGPLQSPGQKRFWYTFSFKEHTIMMATNCVEYGITVNNVSVLYSIHRDRNTNRMHSANIFSLWPLTNPVFILAVLFLSLPIIYFTSLSFFNFL